LAYAKLTETQTLRNFTIEQKVDFYY